MEETNVPQKKSTIDEVDSEYFVYTSETNISEIPKKTLTRLQVDSSVREIPVKAFEDCCSLVKVQLPALSKIGESAFKSCPKLNCVQFISRNASCKSSSMNGTVEDGLVVFPEGMMLRVDDFAFSFCKSLRKVIVCSVNTKLGKGTFKECQGLLSVHLPEGLQVIQPDSFRRCGSLTAAKIPSSVIKIGERAFYGCRSLPSVELPSQLLEIGESSFMHCVSIETLHIPATVSSIGKSAFEGCDALVQVQLPETLSEIRESTFGACPRLKRVQFVSRNASLEAPSINDNSEDGLLVFGEGLVLQIHASAFSYCHSLQKVIVCSTSTKLGNETFKFCLGLLSAHLPEGLQVIEPYLFLHCKSLTTIKIPSSVIKIGHGSFGECSSLVSVDLPHGLLEIGERSFEGCSSIETFYIHPTVSSIGLSAFFRCGGLKRIKLPPALKRIESNTFCDCRSLEYIEIPSTVSFIGRGAFSFCVSLSHLRFPANVGNIVDLAFQHCQNLISIELPEEILLSINNGPSIRHYLGICSCFSLVNMAIPTLSEEGEHLNRFHPDSQFFKIGLPMIGSLKHRFDDSPLNKLCYYQSYHSPQDAMVQLRGLMDENPLAATTQVDKFGMTPLHILSLSQIPNLDMLVAVMKGGNPDHIFLCIDSFGFTPLDYLRLNKMPNSAEVIRSLLQVTIVKRLAPPCLDWWKSDVLQTVSGALADSIRIKMRFDAVYTKLANYERMEILSLLELYLWKARIDEASSQRPMADRESCRINSCASIVIPHVLPFLGKIDMEDYYYQA